MDCENRSMGVNGEDRAVFSGGGVLFKRVLLFVRVLRRFYRRICGERRGRDFICGDTLYRVVVDGRYCGKYREKGVGRR